MARASTRDAPAAPAELYQEIATTRDGRDITRPLFVGLQQPRDPRLLGAVDWGVYDRILLDDQVFSTLQQRRSALLSYDWQVLPGNEEDPRSIEAARLFGDTIKRVGWNNITGKMHYAIFNGYAVAEITWGPMRAETGKLLIDFKQVKVRHARRFRYNDQGELRLLTFNRPQGEPLPERKFWVASAGGSDDDEFYGRGLAEWLYWPTLFKRNGLRFWNIFLDKFGSPTAKGTYRPGTSQGDISKLLGALQAIATDTGIAVPEGIAIELLEAARSGTADYATLCKYMDQAIAKVVLSQTMTTDDGSSRSQAEVHAGVKLEVVKGDDELLSDGFNCGPSRWWTDINYGPDVASPIVSRAIEEEADLGAQAETDEKLSRQGWVRTEESFKATYGEGYERKPLPSPLGREVGASAPGEAEDGAENKNKGLAKIAAALRGEKPEEDERVSLAEPFPSPPAREGGAPAPGEELDEIDREDRLIDQLIADEGYSAVEALSAPLLARLVAAGTEEDVRELLRDGLGLIDERQLERTLANASFAMALDEAHNSPSGEGRGKGPVDAHD